MHTNTLIFGENCRKKSGREKENLTATKGVTLSVAEMNFNKSGFNKVKNKIIELQGEYKTVCFYVEKHIFEGILFGVKINL